MFSVSGLVAINAMIKVTMVKTTAMVNGAGSKYLNALVYLSVKFNYLSSVFQAAKTSFLANNSFAKRCFSPVGSG